MGNDDDIIEVKSYEYGVGVISMIISLLLTVSAGAISLFLLMRKNKADAVCPKG